MARYLASGSAARLAAVAVAAAILVAPAGCQRNHADPFLVPGGGTASGELGRFLNVYVIDEVSGDPIAAAYVRVDGETTLAGETDATGLARFEDRHLRGGQTVTAAAPGYANASWYGVDAANVTIALAGSVFDPNVPTADVRGTIAGWSGLPAPAAGHFWAALVTYSLTRDLSDPANTIVQPTNAMGDSENVCAWFGPPTVPACAWHVVARTGPQAHYYLLLDVDMAGTPMVPDDDIGLLAGWGLLPGLDLVSGATVTNEMLPAPTMTTDTMTVAIGSPPAGLELRFLIPVVELPGDDGRMVAGLPPTPAAVSFEVVGLTDTLAATSYTVLVNAVPPGTAVTPSSLVVAYDITDPSSVTLPPFLDPPAALSASGDLFSYTVSAGVDVVGSRIDDSTPEIVWTVAQLDPYIGGFVLPILDPSEGNRLPTGTLTWSIVAAEFTEFDPANWSAATIDATLVRAADNRLEFTR